MTCTSNKCAGPCGQRPQATTESKTNSQWDTLTDSRKVYKDTNYQSRVLLSRLPYIAAAVVALGLSYAAGRSTAQEAAVAEALAKQPKPVVETYVPDPVIVLIDEQSGACLAMLHNSRTFACSQEIPGALTYQPVPPAGR